MSVIVIDHCEISPPSGSVSSMSLPLTIFDIFWLPFPSFQRLFFYQLHHSKAYFTETILPNIKHSLSLTLQDFFPLCGNLAWPLDCSNPEIRYVDGDFASFYVAESDYDFDTLCRSNATSANAFFPLAPKLLHKSTKELLVPLMAFQVTLFPNKGICIGITFNHVVADGRILHHFIKSWASMCKLEGNEKHTSLLPYYDRSTVNKNPAWVDTACLNYMKKSNITRETFLNVKDNHADPTGKVLATFVMTPCSIKRLRRGILSRIDNETLHLSAFVLTCAYVWCCLIKAKWGDIDASEDDNEQFIYSVDSSSRLDPPLPITYFGNCITPFLLETKRSYLLGKDGMLIAAKLIGNSIQAIENGDALFKQNEWFLSNTVSTGRVVIVAGATKFGIYDTEFGWGKPKKSESITIINSGSISLSECPSEVGGVEVGLARSISEMEAFASMFETFIESFSIE
ncbi:hypothetical protein ACHQM5_016450 [Ranunculus cassubicifolius]